MTRYPIVAIEWVDAHANSGWFTPEQLEEWANQDGYCTDIGVLVKETKRSLVFAQRHTMPLDDEDTIQWGSLHRIPKTWVRRRIVLGYLKENGRVIRKENR